MATETLQRIRLLIQTLESFDASDLTDRTFYDDALGATVILEKYLLESPPDVREGTSQFVVDLCRYFLEDFPRVFQQPFKRFGLHSIYEIGQQEFDTTYTYQDTWAAERVFTLRPRFFVDVGSTVSFVTITSRIVTCIAIDARPTPFVLHNLSYRQAEATALPFENESVPMLTCLHAADHFGLGRYGDTVSNLGVAKAVEEFERVVMKDGFLIIGVPTKLVPATVFNKMHQFTPELVSELFSRCAIIQETFLVPYPVSREQHDAFLAAYPEMYAGYVVLLRKAR